MSFKEINYKEIGEILKAEYSDLSEEFEKRIKQDAPKDVFLWLEKELRGKYLPSELDQLLTDFFFSIH